MFVLHAELVAETLWIDGFTAVHRSDRAPYAHKTAFALYLNVERHGGVRAEILITRERKSAAAARTFLIFRPFEALGCPPDDGGRALITHVPQTKFDRIEFCRKRKLIHEAFEREHVRVCTE